MKFPRVHLRHRSRWDGEDPRHGEDGGFGVLSSAKKPRDVAARRTREVLRLVLVLKTRFVLYFFTPTLFKKAE